MFKNHNLTLIPLSLTKMPMELIVQVPSVKKGLSNQRMRIVQDLVTASLVGSHKVRLPKKMTSRKGCHYEAGCYQNYEASLGFWEVYDRDKTEAALQSLLGITIVDDDSDDDIDSFVALHEYPMIASDLKAQVTKALRRKRNEKKKRSFFRRTKEKPSPKLYFYFYEPRYCCTIVLPDTVEAASLLARANTALVAAKKTTRDAEKVIAAYKGKLPKGARSCALHWRLDDDFVSSDHHLDGAAYVVKMRAAVSGFADDCGRSLFLLGDIANDRLDAIQRHLAGTGETSSGWGLTNFLAGRSSFGGNTTLQLYTKQSLFRGRNWSREYGGFDDLVGAVDFEIGIHADVFFGSPFSSFSVLIANARGDFISDDSSDKATVMPDVDVNDKLAGLFRIQFPSNHRDLPPDPCAAYIALGPKYAKRLERTPSCPLVRPVPQQTHWDHDWSFPSGWGAFGTFVVLLGSFCSIFLVCTNVLFFVFSGNGPIRHRSRKPTTKH